MKKNNWRVEIQQLKIKLQSIIKQVDSERVFLFHYTNAEGLYGILKSGRMWATNTRYLNDPQELEYAREMVKNVLGDRRNFDSEKYKNLWIDVLSKFEELYKETDIYITCFCEHGDLLSQWRGYGSQGGGYSISFNRGKIQNNGRNAEQNKYVLMQVEYNQKKQLQIINGICEASLDSIRKIEKMVVVKEKLEVIVDKVIGIVAKILLYQIARFKHEAFKEENEWRIIYLVDDPNEYITESVNFRFKNGIAIPYLELKLCREDDCFEGKLPIDRIVCGPSLDTTRALKSLTLMRKKFGYDGAVIKKSTFTLRVD